MNGFSAQLSCETLETRDLLAADMASLYDPDLSMFHLEEAGEDSQTVVFGTGESGWIPVMGDWDGDGDDTVGLYDPNLSMFHLNDENASDAADSIFVFGSGGRDWIPVVGDWDGDGDDTVGLYDPHLSMFHLNNENVTKAADHYIVYGTGDSGWLPVVGDWDGDGDDTIGLYDVNLSMFHLNNENATRAADYIFTYGAGKSGWTPLAGDWDGDGDDTIGLFDPVRSMFHLNDQNDSSRAEHYVRLGDGGSGWIPLAWSYEYVVQEWEPGLGYHKDLFIDGGVELSHSGTNAARALGLSYDTLFTSDTAYQNSIMVSSATDLNGALLYPDGQPRYRMYYMNGGSTGHGYTLGAEGRQRVYDFFWSGGSYTGSCAGAFAAGGRWGGVYNIIPNTAFELQGPWGVSMDVSFDSPADAPFREVLDQYVTGPVYNVPFYGGPVFRPGIDSIVGDQIVEGLQYFGRNYDVSGSLYGAPQIAAYTAEGTGQLCVLAGHPEYASGGTNLGLMQAVYAYALDGAKVLPDLKSTLIAGESVEMLDADEKVGDQQYHRYTITVAPGTEALDLALTGLSANADLYVQYGSPANSQSYTHASTNSGVAADTVHIQAPRPGVWHVSVYGEHEVLNGAAYVLMAGSGLG